MSESAKERGPADVDPRAEPTSRETASKAPRIVELRGVNKTFYRGEEPIPVFDDLDFDVPAGAFVALMGPSGSGKSTLMNLLGCLDTPTAGEYWLNGQNVSQLSERRLARIRNKEIGFVFQTFNLLPRTTALENVELPLLYAGLSARERRARARARLAAVGLAARETHHPSQLSGGQQQRVAIARSLVNDPAVVLADEPTGNLDSRTSVELLALMQRLNRAGLTIVLVTHEPDIAAYASRVLSFRDGRLRGDERVAEPRDAATALTTMPDEEEAVA